MLESSRIVSGDRRMVVGGRKGDGISRTERSWLTGHQLDNGVYGEKYDSKRSNLDK